MLNLGGWPTLLKSSIPAGCPTLRGFRRVGTMLPAQSVLISTGAIRSAGRAKPEDHTAKRSAIQARFGVPRSLLRNVADSQFRLSWFVHHNRSKLAVGVVTIAAPQPLLRFEHQAAFDRVAMHVAQLLDPLVLGEDDEVIEASLPDVSAFQGRTPESILPRVDARAETTQNLAGEALLESLHHHRWVGALRFGQQKMNMFRHDHVADDHETVTSSGLLKNVEEKFTIAGRAEERKATVTAGGDEVGVSGTVVTMESSRHRALVT